MSGNKCKMKDTKTKADKLTRCLYGVDAQRKQLKKLGYQSVIQESTSIILNDGVRPTNCT